MRNFNTYKIFLAGLLMHLAVISCIKMEEMSIVENDNIVFTTSLVTQKPPQSKSFSESYSAVTEEWLLAPDTKAEITTKLDGKAKVIGLLSESGDVSSATPWEGFKDVTFTFNGDELTSTPQVRWGSIPTKGNGTSIDNLKLYIYAPIESKTTTQSPEGNQVKVTPGFIGAVLPDEGTSGAPVISYTIPRDKADQTDIITAHQEVARSTGFFKNVPLSFTHALTAIRFKMGFACTVKSITISGVYNKADYTIGSGWDGHEICTTDPKTPDSSWDGSYTIDFGEGKSVEADVNLFDDVLMMIPQTIPFEKNDNPILKVTYIAKNTEKEIKTSLKGIKWEEGKLITYTIHEKTALEYVYFDLNAGDVTITEEGYQGSVYINQGTGKYKVTGEHKSTNKYYVYQSAPNNTASPGYYKNTGWSGEPDNSAIRVPSYDLAYVWLDAAKTQKMLWTDYITNNTSVEDVIHAWDDENGAGKVTSNDGRLLSADKYNKTNAKGAVRNVQREATKNRIHVAGSLGEVNLLIDNVYSTYQEVFQRGRTTGGISFLPTGTTTLTINMVGDNRFGCIHYTNTDKDSNKRKLVFEGTGSVTVADADYYVQTDGGVTGYYSNRSCSAIGGNDNTDHAYNIIINSGVIFAGGTKAEYCTAIGGGGNGYTRITINGGVVTAVASGTGTAIGGGTGVELAGGKGIVTINNGNIYAYNHANRLNIPTSAIGGAGSQNKEGNTGIVTINGGNVYAVSALGTAIGGGSSANLQGGSAEVYIYDGYVVAKSEADNSSGIGGGSSRTNPNSTTAAAKDGGNATIVIGGKGKKPIVRTGSIGGGSTTNGQIGSANITIEEGDIQAQFVMAASPSNTFTMNGGTIRNSYHTDTEYKHIQKDGGAVYMMQGTFLMNDGEIRNCTGENGGAVYIAGVDSENTTFTMNGGSILQSTADYNGGALYIENGTVTLNGGIIQDNLAKMGNGGAICIQGGNFYMPEGSTAEIINNAAYSNNTVGRGNGGGVFVTSKSNDTDQNKVTVDILSGKIQQNTSDRYGGGLSVDMTDKDNVEANVTVGIPDGSTNTNPLITNNRASLLGGGLYVKGEKSNIVINDGKIMENLVAGYAANENVANEGGMVTLNGGDVTHVVVTYKPNGGNITLNGEAVASVSQKIVTATNSKMVVPGTFSRTGWHIVAWHTRQDGNDSRGTRYPIDAILNLDSSITLYAQWEEN